MMRARRARTVFLFAAVSLCCVSVSGRALASDPTAACRAIAAELPAVGESLPPKSILDVLRDRPHPIVVIDEPSGNVSKAAGLTMKSTYGGSLVCQENELTRDAGGKDIDLPGDTAGGETLLCGPEKVRFFALDGIPAIAEQDSSTPGGSIYGDVGKAMAVYTLDGDRWSKGCTMSIAATPRFGVEEQYCDPPACGVMRTEPVRLADGLARPGTTIEQLSPFPTGAVGEQWRAMLDKAKAIHLANDPLPVFGYSEDGSLHGFMDWSVKFAPFTINGRLLLGKIGIAGIGSRFGTSMLFAAYDYDDGDFVPLAGLSLRVMGETVMSKTVAALPK